MPEWVSIPGGIVVMIIGGYLSIRNMYTESIWRIITGVALMLAGLIMLSLGVIYTLDTQRSGYTCVEVTE